MILGLQLLYRRALCEALHEVFNHVHGQDASSTPTIIGVDTSSAPDLSVIDGKFYRDGERVLPCRKPPDN